MTDAATVTATSAVVRPLAQLLLRKLFFASVIIAIGIFGVQLISEYRSQRKTTLTTLQSLASTFEPAVAHALWTYEDAQLKSLIKGIGMHPDVVQVDVVDSKGRPNASWRRPAGHAASPDLQVKQALHVPDAPGKLAGTLVIVSSEAFVRAHLLAALSTQLLTSVLLLGALASVLWFLINKHALRPLASLSKRVRALSTRGADQSFEPVRTDVAEIQTLQDRFRFLLQQVAEQNQNLEQQVIARTQELGKKNTELAAADQAKSAFLATMSHEIRTPMNGILGMLKLLEHTQLTARQLDYKQKAEGATRALLGIINDILDFSKIEAGKMELDLQPFALSEVMRDLSVIVAANLGDKSIEVLFSVDPNIPPYLLGDAMRLRQVLLNLAGNAIKFTSKGEVLVAVRALATSATSVTLEFSVSDSGIGIAAAQLDRIFEGFSQAEASTTRRFGGTGLGLAICKRLVALMGAEMRVTSTPGKGSRFAFTVQLDLAPASAEAASTHAQTHGRVLVVDDNAMAREVLQEMAGSLGWHSECMASGEAALAHLQDADTLPYQVILMDWRMPGLDGWETTRRLRQLDRSLQAPVIIMVSAHGRELLIERAQHDTAMLDGYLVKPVTASMLFDAVLQAQAQRSGEPLAGPSGVASDQHLAGLRLLVVEDNLLNQEIARELLTDMGAQVDIAGGGLAGVAQALCAAPPFDAILMDMQMPDIDGLEATRRIRADPRMAGVPIIAMTANAMEADKQACRAAGMVDHVSKPIELDKLIDTLLRHTGGQAGAVPAQVPAGQPSQPQASFMEVDHAVKRLGGKRAFYAKVLASFAADAQAQLSQCQQDLSQGRVSDAQRCLHTLRGLAATVGARRLGHCVAQGEAALHTQPGLLDTREIERQLALALQFFQDQGLIASATSTADAATATLHMSAEQQQALAQALDGLDADLRARRMRAVKIFASIVQEFGASLGARLDALAQAVAALNFEAGLQASQALRASLAPQQP